MEIIKEFIKPELLILVPVMYIIGMGIKASSINDRLIPFILGFVSIILSALYVIATTDLEGTKQIAMAIFTAITQGILIAGASVYFNQMFKQITKK
jgi:multidrug transporter EmrE-like cation transporter